MSALQSLAVKEFPSLPEAKTAPKGKRKFNNRPRTNRAPVQDLESQLRGMILSHTLAEGTEPGRVKNNPAKVKQLNSVPPHLRSAPIADQEAYLKRQEGKLPGPSPSVSNPEQNETAQQASITEKPLPNRGPQAVQTPKSHNDPSVLPRRQKPSQSEMKKIRAQQKSTLLLSSTIVNDIAKGEKSVFSTAKTTVKEAEVLPSSTVTNDIVKDAEIAPSSTTGDGILKNAEVVPSSTTASCRAQNAEVAPNSSPLTSGPTEQHRKQSHHPNKMPKQPPASTTSIQTPNSIDVQHTRRNRRHYGESHMGPRPQNTLILPPQFSQGAPRNQAYQHRNRSINPPRHHQLISDQQHPNQRYVQGIPLQNRPRQLYDHSSTNGMQSNNYQRGLDSKGRFESAPLLEQIDYLNQLATVEVPLAEVSNEDLRAKERLREILENVCRSATSEYEHIKDPDFDPGTVALKCFGSLSSGFATRSSDMDLALVSPTSKPNPASPESEIPRLLEKALLDMGYGARLLTRTRVPIIKFCEKPTPELAETLMLARCEWEKSQAFPPSSRETAKVNPDDVAREAPELDEAESLRELDVVEKKPLEERRVSNDIAQKDQSIPNSYPSENGNFLHVNQGIDVDKTSKQVVNSSNSVESPPRSDKELTRLYMLAISEDWFDDRERKIIFRFTTALKDNTNNVNDRNNLELDEARAALKSLPDVLSRYREKQEDPLNFPKHGVGIQCDINFSNPLAVHNTHLLRCYALCDPRIRPMVLLVKTWAKRRKINSPYHGTLSSYGYVLMVLHFVINVADPPLAPNLQLSRRPPPRGSDPKVSDTICDGCDVRFWRSEREIKDCVRKGTLMPDRNRESIGSLLRNFFQYFAHQGPHVFRYGFMWTSDVLSLRTPGGRLLKADKGWTGAKIVTIESKQPGHESTEIKHRYLFCIEDPFEVDHNIARTVVHHGIVAIRDEFRRAHRIILHAGFDGGIPTNLFEEAKDPPLQRSYFGPKPRPVFGPENLAEHLRPGASTNTEPSRGLNAKTSQEFTGALSPVSNMPSDLEDEPVPAMTLDDQDETDSPPAKKEKTEELEPKLNWYGEAV